MAELIAGGRHFEIDLVVFDKDGTLIDFNFLWGRRTRRCVDALSAVSGAGEPLRAALYRSLGYDPVTDSAAADGPLATIPRAKLVIITATVLYQHGLGWHEAEQLAGDFFSRYMTAPPAAEDIRPLGDVAGLCATLQRAGVHSAVLTADDRTPTERTLDLIGAGSYISAMVCGDDPIAPKPSADGILHLAELFNIPGARIMMAGDTSHDLLAGRNAGVGCCLGVLSGTGGHAALSAHADVIVASIHAIRVV
jgi:phosphoglycolate phosphatase-like HAD superfamily hydrolase